MRSLDDIYREVLWRTSLTSTDFPYKFTTGGDYGFIQAFADVYKYLVTEVIYTDSNYFLEKTNLNLTVNVEDYYTPNDLVRLRYMEFALDGTNFYKAYEFDPIFFSTSEQGTVSAGSMYTPKFWSMGSINAPSSHFQIAPKALQTVTNGIKIYYDRMPSALLSTPVSDSSATTISAASAVVFFPGQFDYLIPLGVAVEVWGRYGVLDQKQTEVTRYKTGVEDMKRLLKPRVSIGQKRVRDFREI